MSEAWFCYTILFILACLFSASMALSAYFVSRREVYLGIMAFFLIFCLETALILLDEYSYLKPSTREACSASPSSIHGSSSRSPRCSWRACGGWSLNS